MQKGNQARNWHKLFDDGAIWIALVALFLVSWLVEPRTVSILSLTFMLPFAAILAVAAIGQTLVIQQGGIDLSVGGTITLVAVMVSGLDTSLPVALFVVACVCLVIGAVIGLAVNILRVTSLITTLAMGTILGGVALAYTNGSSSSAPQELVRFATGSMVGISNVAWLAFVLVAAAWLLMNGTSAGRRFVAVGSNVRAARAAGIRPLVHGMAAYVLAALAYGVAGVVLAGYVQSPGINVGQSYMLSSIAAVVVGGTSLGGGRGRMIGSVVGALLLSQLTLLVHSLGVPTSAQMVVQAAVIAVAAGVQPESRRIFMMALRRLGLSRHPRSVSTQR